MKESFIKNLRWISAVSRRFARVDRKGRSAVTSVLATLGICFGVMTLITVMSIMNGFQMNFIDAIMEVSSYHIRGSGVLVAERIGRGFPTTLVVQPAAFVHVVEVLEQAVRSLHRNNGNQVEGDCLGSYLQSQRKHAVDVVTAASHLGSIGVVRASRWELDCAHTAEVHIGVQMNVSVNALVEALFVVEVVKIRILAHPSDLLGVLNVQRLLDVLAPGVDNLGLV